MIEVDSDLVAVNFDFLEQRAAGNNVLLVGLVERPLCKAITDVLFVARVNVPRVSDVVNDGHTCVGDRRALSLRFTNLCPAVAAFGLAVGIPEVGQLNKIEGEVALIPDGAPSFDERLFLVVVAFAFAAV